MGSDDRVLQGDDHLTPFWFPIDSPTVLRAAWLGAVWAVLAAVVGAVLVAAIVLVGASVSAIVGFFGDSVGLSETTRRTAFVGGGLAASGAVIASAWAAAYSSTREASRWRMLAGSALGLALGLGLVGVGSLGAPGAALAGAWGMAVPSDRVGRAALRSLPLALAALLPVFQVDEGWVQWLVAGAAGVMAAWVWIAVAEGLWSAVGKISSRVGPSPGIMQNKTDTKPDVERSQMSIEERDQWRTST